jgi:hypothetical protein
VHKVKGDDKRHNRQQPDARRMPGIFRRHSREP